MFDFSIAVEITYSRESTKFSHSRKFFRAYSPAELIFLETKNNNFISEIKIQVHQLEILNTTEEY